MRLDASDSEGADVPGVLSWPDFLATTGGEEVRPDGLAMIVGTG